MKADVLFIHPGNHRKTYQQLSQEYTAVAPPAWAGLLAAALARDGYRAAIYDTTVEGWGDDSAGSIADAYEPRLIVIMVYGHNPSASTQTMPAARRIAGDIKEYNSAIPIAFGGTHPSALPERTLLEEPIDFVIKGEGLYQIRGLLRWLSGKGDISSVNGVWRKADGKPAGSPPAPLVADLDRELPGYAWDLLPDLSRYRAHTMHCFQDFEKSSQDDFSDVRSPYVSLNTSLGCPYTCSYCCINAVFGKPRVRYWSLDTVMGWIDTLVEKHKIRNIRLDDELFILSPARVEQFCDRVIERGYDLNLWVYGRVDTIPENLLRKMKRAGINWICLGIESASDGVRRGVNKKIGADIRAVVGAIRAQGINVLGNFMFGLPDDDRSSMEETLRLALDLNCEFVNFYCVMAYPGSELYARALGKAGALPDSWEAYAQLGYETRPLATNHLSSNEVLAFRDRAFRLYFSSPEYLAMIRNSFGGKVERHLKDMLTVPVRRKLLEPLPAGETVVR